MKRARVAVTVVFALNGALFASIFSRLPAIQERAGIGDGALGLAAVSGMGYVAFVAGPPAVGGLAEGVGLRVGLVLVVGLCVLAAALAGSLCRRAEAREAGRVREAVA